MANKIISTVWKHKVVSGIMIVVIAGGVYYFWPRGGSTNATIYTYGTVQKGSIIQSVTDSGQVAAVSDVQVKSQVSGTLSSLSAIQGQSVKAGDVLAQLDAADAQAAVNVAKANLANAKLSSQQASQNNSLSLAQAKQNLQQANDNLSQSQGDLSKTYDQAFNTVTSTFTDLPTIMAGMDDILNGSNSVVIQNDSSYISYYQYAIVSAGGSTANLLGVGATYTAAKSSYDSVLAEYKGVSRYSDPATVTKLVNDSYDATKKISNAVKAVISLIQQYRDVVSNNNGTPQSFSATQLTSLGAYLNTANSDLVGLLSTQQSINTATQTVTDNQNAVIQQTQSLSTLETLTNPISDQSQETTIAQKETALTDAIQTLGYYTIRAPFDGVLASVADLQKGDSVGGSTVIAEVVTNSQEAVVSMNEVDAANVKVGQKATLTFDALPDLTMTGRVSEVDTIGTVSQGVVSYNVTVAFDIVNDQVKPGMSVTAAIITNIEQDVLTVPNSAVKSNASESYILIPSQPVNGAASGSSESGATVKQQIVTVGIADDNNTEIVSGLNEGDTVVTKTATQAISQTVQNASALSRILGGGGAGGGAFVRPAGGNAGTGTTRSSGSSNSSGSTNSTRTGQ